MWNFLVSGLSVGCTLVLYDGSPLKDPGLLWRMSDDLGITIFGTSAKYLDHLSVRALQKRVILELTRSDRKGTNPERNTTCPRSGTFTQLALHWLLLYSIMSMKISARRFCLAQLPVTWLSLSLMHMRLNADVGIGGTDICSLFAGMNSALPVYRGEIQCRMLGMAIESYSPSGVVNAPGEPGELVCTRPFPCMPLGFWPLPGYGAEAAVKAANERFRQSYFSEFEGVWCKSSFT